MALKLGEAEKPLKIIFDSNALFVPLQFKIDIFEELKTLLNVNLEFILPSPILQELKMLAEKKSPIMRKNASYALKLAEKCKLLNVPRDFSGSPDDAVVEAARRGNSAVFTNDRQLKKRLRNINVPVIYVRQKSRLEIDGRI